jgi:hypothetical protein
LSLIWRLVLKHMLGETEYMFMCLMIMFCSTLFTELLLYVLYTCSAASVPTVWRDQRLLCPICRYYPLTCSGLAFCKASRPSVWPLAASARRRFETLTQQKFRRSWPVDFAVFRLLQITAHRWQGFHKTSYWDVHKKCNYISLFVFFISLLIVAQHVSGNHVPIIRSWRLRYVIVSCWYVPWLQEGCQDRLAGSASMDALPANRSW